jgi:transcriptional regulator with XRE-family HTH domain
LVIDLATYRGHRNAVDLDRQLGFVLRRRRQQLGMTQVQLARQVDIVPQQITKYERGLNRVGAARLIRLAHALDLPLDRLAE